MWTHASRQCPHGHAPRGRAAGVCGCLLVDDILATVRLRDGLLDRMTLLPCVLSTRAVNSCESRHEMASTAVVTVSPGGGLEHGDSLGAGVVVNKDVCGEHTHEGMVVWERARRQFVPVKCSSDGTHLKPQYGSHDSPPTAIPRMLACRMPVIKVSMNIFYMKQALARTGARYWNKTPRRQLPQTGHEHVGMRNVDVVLAADLPIWTCLTCFVLGR